MGLLIHWQPLPCYSSAGLVVQFSLQGTHGTVSNRCLHVKFGLQSYVAVFFFSLIAFSLVVCT